MSIVAVRGNLIAADTGGTGNNLKFPVCKLVKSNNVAIGWAGNWVDGKTFAHWYFAGADRKKLPRFHNRTEPGSEPDFSALVLRPDGWEYWTDWMVPEMKGENLSPYFAIGSGAQAAMAAMYLDKNAEEAARIACAVADGCEGPVIVYKVSQK